MSDPAEVRSGTAEWRSLRAYLEEHLPEESRQRVLALSFNHWDFALVALAESALALRDLGSSVEIGLWADRTPMHDAGWLTSERMARLLMSHTRENAVRESLIRSGLPVSAFVDPPVDRWRPAEPLPDGRPLNRSQIRSLTYRGTPMGRAILQVHPDRDTPVTDEHLWPGRWIERAARSYAYVFDQTVALIDRDGITATVLFNGRFLHDRAAREACLARGVPVLATEYGGTDTDFDLTVAGTHDWSDFQRRILDLYARWDASERDAIGSSWFLDRVGRIDADSTRFTDGQVPGQSTGLPSADTVVVFFSSSGDEIAELDLDWSRYFGGQGGALKVLADACRARPGTALIVRSHPHKRVKPSQDLDDWLRDVAAAAPDLHLDPFSPVDSYTLMRQADVVVTFGSTTGVEAAFAGRPVIVMGPSVYGELGCAVEVSDREGLDRALEACTPGSHEAAVAFGLMMRKRGFVVSRVRRTAEGYELAGVPLTTTAARVRQASHLQDRLMKWYLNRR